MIDALNFIHTSSMWLYFVWKVGFPTQIIRVHTEINTNRQIWPLFCSVCQLFFVFVLALGERPRHGLPGGLIFARQFNSYFVKLICHVRRGDQSVTLIATKYGDGFF